MDQYAWFQHVAPFVSCQDSCWRRRGCALFPHRMALAGSGCLWLALAWCGWPLAGFGWLSKTIGENYPRSMISCYFLWTTDQPLLNALVGFGCLWLDLARSGWLWLAMVGSDKLPIAKANVDISLVSAKLCKKYWYFMCFKRIPAPKEMLIFHWFQMVFSRNNVIPLILAMFPMRSFR